MRNLCLFFCLLTSPLLGLGESFSLSSPTTQQKILVHNRILAQVNGKPISTIDLMKKMDTIFFRQFPEYRHSVPAKHQFYRTNWRHLLSDLIDKELVLADAEENKLQVSAGDVREEMENMFGPNIISNLDQIGLSFDEAYKMVLGDITIRRMLFFRVNSKALKAVTPQDIIAYYDKVASENVRLGDWTYQVISIRDLDPEKASKATEAIFQHVKESKEAPGTIWASLKELVPSKETTKVSLSQEFKHNEKEVSENYQEILKALKPGDYSTPVVQKSRSQGVLVFRIFYLKDASQGGVISYQEMEAPLKEQLLDEAIEKETVAYFQKLRKHFDIDEERLKQMIPEGFEPFELSS